jgi:hypothetical protein
MFEIEAEHQRQGFVIGTARAEQRQEQRRCSLAMTANLQCKEVSGLLQGLKSHKLSITCLLQVNSHFINPS